jgi:hypothetical protein
VLCVACDVEGILISFDVSGVLDLFPFLVAVVNFFFNLQVKSDSRYG